MVSKREADRRRAAIVDTWRQEKASDPSLTTAEFAKRMFGTKEFEQYANRDSAARQIRKVLSGERTGAKLYERPDVGGKWNIRFQTASGRVFSANVTVEGANKRFDTALARDELKSKARGDITAQFARWRRRYGAEVDSLDPDEFTVRGVRVDRAPIRFRVHQEEG